MNATAARRSARSRSENESLREAIKASVANLGGYGDDYPIHFEVPAGMEAIPATRLFEPENLRKFSLSSVGTWHASAGDKDPRALIAQLWREYSYCLIAPLVVPLANGVLMDFALERVAVVMKDGTPYGLLVDLERMPVRTCAERATSWPVSGPAFATLAELRAAACANVLVENARPAIERVLGYVKLSRQLLWCQIAEAIDGGYDDAHELNTGEELARLAADRDVLLFSKELPGVPGPNPLYDQLKWEPIPGFKRPQQLRKVCCFRYVLEGSEELYCRTCPVITRDERLMLWGRFAARPAAQVHLVRPRPLELRRK